MTSVASYGGATTAGNAVIYVLRDPRFRGRKSIRYVGKTCLSLEARLAAHLKDLVKHSGYHKAHWMLGLVGSGLKPTIKVLEFVVGEDWQSREIYWIAKLRLHGCPLTNSTVGGDGVRIYDEAVREKMRKSALSKPPMSAETRAKLSKAGLGRKISPEARAKSSAAQRGISKGVGRKHTAETKAKMSASQRALTRVVSPEMRAHLAEAAKGRKHTAEAKAKMSLAQRGVKKGKRRGPPSPETRDKLRAAHLALNAKNRADGTVRRGHKLSAETRAKIGAAGRLRVPISAETRERMRQSAIALRARERAARKSK